MRKVFYGLFVDFMPPSYDYDSGLIGAHRYVRHAQEEALKTAGYEYYMVVDGQKVTIKDAKFIEKAFARFKFLFTSNKKKVLGVRNELKVNPYSGHNPQLGVKLDENGKKVVDESYYKSAEKRVELDQNLSREEQVERLKRIREKYEETKKSLEEDQKLDDVKIAHR